MTRRRTGRGSGAKKRTQTYWAGIQFPTTAITTGRLINVLVDKTVGEFMSRTIVSVRGWITYANHGSDSVNGPVRVASKLGLVDANDAGTLNEFQPLDTDQEDIARRQLWTYSTIIPQTELNAGEGRVIQVEINVKVKIKLPPTGKALFVMVHSADITNRAVIAGYLRALTVR